MSKTDVHSALKEGSRGGGEGRRTRRRLSSFLTAELALTMMLLYGMGTGVRSVFDHSKTDLVMHPAQLLTASVSLPDGRYPTSDQRLAFYRRLIDRLGGTPPIAAATVSSVLPLGGAAARQLAIEGRKPAGDTPPPTVDMVAIASGYFRTMDLQMSQGRMFDQTDGRAGHESAIVNQRFADLFFAKANPIDHRRLTIHSAAAQGARTRSGRLSAARVRRASVRGNRHQDRCPARRAGTRPARRGPLARRRRPGVPRADDGPGSE